MMCRFERIAVAGFLVAFSAIGLVAEAFGQGSTNRPIPRAPVRTAPNFTMPSVNRPIRLPNIGKPSRTGNQSEETASPTPKDDAPKRVKNPPKKKKPNKRLASSRTSQTGLPKDRPEFLAVNNPNDPRAIFLAALRLGYEPDILLVEFESEAGDPDINNLADAYDLEIVEIAELGILQNKLVKLRISDDDLLPDKVREMGGDGVSASPNYYYGTEAKEKGAKSIQFAPKRMSVDEAHKIATGNAVKIAIIDTGIDDKHAELSGSIVERFDAVGAAADAPIKHGTAMAGVIAAKDQITGIAPNVEILSAQAFAPPKTGESATGTTFAIIKSMDWAYKSGARVFNLSFAGPKDKLLIQALDALADHDTIMIGAAGNAGPGKPPAYPAAHDGVIAVTATDQNDGLYAMANRGSYVAVAAPGVDIITTTPGGGYEFMSGTSIATAHITGVVALVLERHPELKAGQIAQLLANASVDLGPKGFDSEFGAGLVDAAAALKSSDEMADTDTYGLTAGQ